MKKIVSAILFSVLLYYSFQMVNEMLFIKTEVNAAKDLVLEPKKTIDVFFLGTSYNFGV